MYVLEAGFDKDFKSLDVSGEGLKTLYIYKKAGIGTRTQEVQAQEHKLKVGKEIIGSMKLARVNQSEAAPTSAPVGRSVHIGWALFLHPVPDPVLTQHSTTVNLFGLLTFDPFYFFVCFFPNPDHTTLQPNHPSYLTDLAPLLTCILALPTNPLCIYPLFFHG